MTAQDPPQSKPFRLAPPTIRLQSNTLEAMKWIGLVAMTIDHVNKHLLSGSVPWMFAVGRIALPLFCVALAANLARPEAIASGALRRTATRLAVFGAIASGPFLALGGLGWGWWPLNILLTLCLCALCAWLFVCEVPGSSAASVALALFGGAFVEFWWPAIGCFLFAWAYFKHPTHRGAVGWFLAMLALYVINKNFWAFAAIPVIALTAMAPLKIPRLRGLFYWYYPAHLAAIWLAQRVTSGPG